MRIFFAGVYSISLLTISFDTDSNASSRSFVRVEECSSTISELRATIKGRPAIIKQHILNNRYQVLTQDSAGVVQLWDVLKARSHVFICIFLY